MSRASSKKCPACQGKGRRHDRSLLPWNNMAVFAVIIGISGLIGSACMDDNRRALLIGGFAFGGIGVFLYCLGENCPYCEGSGKARRGTSAGGVPQEPDAADVMYVGVAIDPEKSQLPPKPPADGRPARRRKSEEPAATE